MKSLATVRRHPNGFLVVAALAFLFLVLPKPAHAFVVGWMVYGISLILSAVIGIAISIEAWLLGFILQINIDIVNSPPVALGFPVMLSIANLGFVFAIVVIAIMTILRYEGYGAKQTLWKLIVMAIAVNFGLIIAGAVLNFTDQFSLYFLNEINPAGSVGTTAGSFQGAQSYWNFASAVAGAFQPQKFAILDPAKLGSPTTGFSLRGFWDYITADLTTAIGAHLIQPIASLFFSLSFLFAIVIVLGFLIAMLLTRYVYLGLLLVLLPLAWASFIFPATKKQWDRWWSGFLKQAFFAPFVVFFLWVALQTSYNMSTSGTPYFKLIEASKRPQDNFLWAGVQQFFQGIFGGVIKDLLQLTVVLGLMFGGIVAANAMGIQFADAALKAAQGSARWFGTAVGRKAVQYGTAPVRRGWFGASPEKIQQWADRRKTTLGRYTAGWIAKGATRLATAGGEDLVKQHAEEVKKMNTRDLQSAIRLTTRGPRFVALSEELGSRKALEGVPMSITHSESAKREAANYGHAPDYKKKVETTSGVSAETYQAQQRGASPDELRNLTANFVQGLTKADIRNIQLKDLFAKLDPLKGETKFGLNSAALQELRNAFLYGVAAKQPTVMPNIITNLPGSQLDVVQEAYPRELDRARNDGVIDQNQHKERFRRFNRAMMNAASGIPSGEGGGAPAAGP